PKFCLEWLVSIASVIIFMWLTLYDSKKIKEMAREAVLQGDALAVSRIRAIGALKLYLDLINLFIFIFFFILSITGGRK
ncbi:MAG: Bax inhibitor-1 family protein, partial [Dehalococcoidia bacterium]